MKFRKKPVVIEAEQYFKDKKIEGVCTKNHPYDRYDIKHEHVIENHEPHVHTLEGTHLVSEGDWVVKGVKGEFYPVKPDIFEQTYEKVN